MLKNTLTEIAGKLKSDLDELHPYITLDRTTALVLLDLTEAALAAEADHE